MGRTMSMSPLRAQSAVLSKPVLSRSGPSFTVCGERGVDQPLVVPRERLVTDSEPRARGERKIGDEDVGVEDKPVEDLPPRHGLEVQGEAPLVPVVDEPAVVDLARRIAGGVAQVSERVPGRRFELDDLRTEVRHHGGGGPERR